MPPKGVKRKANNDGRELIDCEGEEISLEEFHQECGWWRWSDRKWPHSRGG